MDPSNQEQIKAFWAAYQAHDRELTDEVIKLAIAALPAKTPLARALTLNGMIEARMNDVALAHQLRPALIAAWKDLPEDVRDTLIQYRWQLIGGPEMLPLLRQIVDEPPPPGRTMASMTRDAALKHIYELDPDLGRSLIVRDLDNKGAQRACSSSDCFCRSGLRRSRRPRLNALLTTMRGNWIMRCWTRMATQVLWSQSNLCSRLI